jgi:hypothetical protein
MRIILLDHSGSMGEPFSGKAEFVGRTRTTDASFKLQAAKTELLRSVASLASATSVALFEFTSTASLIYEGMSNDQAAIQCALDALGAEDGTDIAAALDKTSEYVTKLRNVPIIQVLIISDGLSDRASAEAAAQRFAQQGAVIINVILIDPTEDGEQVARAIAVNGEVYAVTSSGEFAERITDVTKEQEKLARQVDAVFSEYQIEEDAVTAKASPEERLSFTAAYPGAMSAGSWYSLLIYLHLADLQEQVAEIIRQKAAQIGLRPLTSSAEAATLLKRGTWLRFTPRLEGVVFNPLSQEVAWLEDIQELVFRLIADKSMVGRPLLGSVDVYCGPALIAQIPLSISIRELADETVAPVTSRTQIFNRVFASYSHEDTAIVEACVAVYETLGIYVYIDKHSLQSGQLWHIMLRRFIDNSDLFQLYWSKASSHSTAVEDEWRYALSLSGRKGESFIRPVYWEEEWPKPYPELSHIHFAKLDIDTLVAQTGQVNLSSQISQSSTERATASLPVTVVPVQPGILPEVQKTVQQDVAYAVNFLEETTGLRYYPVPTLLVDHHIVKSARSLHTTDWASQSDQVDRALALSDVLKSIELKFHTRGWHLESTKIDNLEDLFGKGRLVTADQFDYLRSACEVLQQRIVHSYIQPSWLKGREKLRAESPQFRIDQRYSEFILSTIDFILTTAKPERCKSVYDFYFWDQRCMLELDMLKDQLSRAGINVPSTKDSHDISGLVSALRLFYKELQAILPNYDDVDIVFPSNPIPQYQMHIAIARVVSKISRTITSDGPYDSPGQQLGEWLLEVMNPAWRQMRDELANLSFHNFNSNLSFIEFITQVLDTIYNLLREGLRNLGDFHTRNGYSIKKSSWDILQKEIPNLGLKPTISREEEKVLLEGPFSEFVRVYGKAKDRLLNILSQRIKFKTPLEQLFVVQVSTYGIYIPANSLPTDDRLKRWAFDRGVPTELTFPQNSRVLFCLTALEQFEKALEKFSAERQKVQQMAREFQRSVLIHEHFHAILETGLDEKHATATGVRFEDAWRSASPLNESLAVWMELHAARQKPELKQLVWDYIQAGSYPQWPYRGAEKIEALYQQQGIEAIRSLILSLRRDPEAAQIGFDTVR